MIQERKIALKTMGIKATVLNKFRKEFFNKTLEDFTEDEKLALFESLFLSVKAAHIELNRYKAKRKYKAQVRKLRKERALAGVTK